MPSSESVPATRTAISPRLAIRTVWNMRSHPEDAVADGFERRVAGGGQGEPEHRAGVGRVDHAVVPEPRGGVVRVALVLVLGADRVLEPLLVGRRPLVAARFELVAANGGEDGGRLLATHPGDPRVGPHPEETGRS